MTYRERRARRAERLRGWADKREARSDTALGRAHQIMDAIPFGQPILVGHHSEGRARADVRRIDSGLRSGFEHADTARDFRSRADNIERAAARAIYSDDVDAVERLEQRIAGARGRARDDESQKRGLPQDASRHAQDHELLRARAGRSVSELRADESLREHQPQPEAARGDQG
jgi:hypothetical protein